MRRFATHVGIVIGLLGSATLVAQSESRTGELAAILKRAGEQVELYFARAQSLVCLEIVRLQPLDSGLSPDGFGRMVESELRLSWDPLTPSAAPPEARTLRQVLKVNGHLPRKDDRHNCTTPEQQDSETQPLSMLLADQRPDYAFSMAAPGKLDGRRAIIINYRLLAKPTVDVREVDGKDDCISFDVNGGLRGRIWLNADTYEVMRLDQALSGLVDIPMPRTVSRRPGVADHWVMERWDTSIRFKPISFQDPPETLMLPVSSTSLRITRGAGTPRLRTITEYSRYQRFLTGARVVQP